MVYDALFCYLIINLFIAFQRYRMDAAAAAEPPFSHASNMKISCAVARY